MSKQLFDCAELKFSIMLLNIIKIFHYAVEYN